MEFINCTPHAIVMNDGRVFEASGQIARVSSSFTEFDAEGICTVKYGDLTGVPAPKEGVKYIVSAMVLAASDRADSHEFGSCLACAAYSQANTLGPLRS